MDFDREWTQFALDAEHDHFGFGRIVKAHNALRAERDSLRAEIEALKRDADRYKWLRNCSAEQRTKAMFCLAGDCRWWRTSEEMDTGIDVAMSQQERA